MHRHQIKSIVLIFVLLCTGFRCGAAYAFKFHKHNPAPIAKSNVPQAPNKPPLKSAAPTSDQQDESNNAIPVLTPPSSLDISTAKFGALDINLQDSSFLEASVRSLHVHADKVDFTTGTVEALGIHAYAGEFQDFTIDDLDMHTEGTLKFEVPKLLNEKVLQFTAPANAHVKVIVSQASLNSFLNSREVLSRLSGSARKRVPILSTLAKQNVTFGFNFLRAHLILEPENHVHLTMDAKLGMGGNGGMPVALSAETMLMLENGWVNLADTKLSTGGALVPHDLSGKIVRRINSLSKWGSRSDNIRFQFTDLKVIPEDRLELTGTAQISRLEFGRDQDELQNPDTRPKPP